MGCVVEIPHRGFWWLLRHKLFRCHTFWKLRPFYHCSKCGKGLRCYWDGNDIEGHGIDICNACARKIEKARQETCGSSANTAANSQSVLRRAEPVLGLRQMPGV